MRKLLLQICIGILGLFIAVKLVPGVAINELQILIFSGLVLGLANYFIKPILKKITFPIRIITLGLFSFVINMAIIWGVDILFPELIIIGLLPLFWTALIVWGLGLTLPLFVSKRRKVITPTED